MNFCNKRFGNRMEDIAKASVKVVIHSAFSCFLTEKKLTIPILTMARSHVKHLSVSSLDMY